MKPFNPQSFTYLVISHSLSSLPTTHTDQLPCFLLCFMLGSSPLFTLVGTPSALASPHHSTADPYTPPLAATVTLTAAGTPDFTLACSIYLLPSADSSAPVNCRHPVAGCRRPIGNHNPNPLSPSLIWKIG